MSKENCLDCLHFKCTYGGYPGGYSGPPEDPEGFCKYGLLWDDWFYEAEHCNEFISCDGLREDMECQFIVRGYEWAIGLIKKIVEFKTGIQITKVGFNKYLHEDIAVFHLGYDPKNEENCFHHEIYDSKIYEGMELKEASFSANDGKVDMDVEIEIGQTKWLIKDEKWVRYNNNYIVFSSSGA